MADYGKTEDTEDDKPITSRAFPHWKRGKILGRGAHGIVYLGRVEETRKLVAVKSVKTDDMEAADLEAIEHEIRINKGLSHPNIVQYLGTENRRHTLNIFLEYAPRGSLRQLLQERGSQPLDVATASRYTVQILRGLAYLHSNGIAHRDIKGANVLLAAEGHCKLADFGASKRVEALSIVSGLKGTPHWMAPEVIKGQQTPHGWKKADVWSIGCTVIEMLTGRSPWPQFPNPMAAMYHIAQGERPPLDRAAFPHVSDAGDEFVEVCCTQDPEARPSCQELLATHAFLADALAAERVEAAANAANSAAAAEAAAATPQTRAEAEAAPAGASGRTGLGSGAPSAATTMTVCDDYDDDDFDEDDEENEEANAAKIATDNAALSAASTAAACGSALVPPIDMLNRLESDVSTIAMGHHMRPLTPSGSTALDVNGSSCVYGDKGSSGGGSGHFQGAEVSQLRLELDSLDRPTSTMEAPKFVASPVIPPMALPVRSPVALRGGEEVEGSARRRTVESAQSVDELGTGLVDMKLGGCVDSSHQTAPEPLQPLRLFAEGDREGSSASASGSSVGADSRHEADAATGGAVRPHKSKGRRIDTTQQKQLSPLASGGVVPRAVVTTGGGEIIEGGSSNGSGSSFVGDDTSVVRSPRETRPSGRRRRGDRDRAGGVGSGGGDLSGGGAAAEHPSHSPRGRHEEKRKSRHHVKKYQSVTPSHAKGGRIYAPEKTQTALEFTQQQQREHHSKHASSRSKERRQQDKTHHPNRETAVSSNSSSSSSCGSGGGGDEGSGGGGGGGGSGDAFVDSESRPRGAASGQLRKLDFLLSLEKASSMGAAAVRQAALLEVGSASASSSSACGNSGCSGGGGGGAGAGAGGHNNPYSRASGGLSTNGGGGGGGLRYSKSAGVAGVATPSMGATRLPPMLNGDSGNGGGGGGEGGNGGGEGTGLLPAFRDIASAPSAVHASLQLPSKATFDAANNPLLLRNSYDVSTPLGLSPPSRHTFGDLASSPTALSDPGIGRGLLVLAMANAPLLSSNALGQRSTGHGGP